MGTVLGQHSNPMCSTESLKFINGFPFIMGASCKQHSCLSGELITLDGPLIQWCFLFVFVFPSLFSSILFYSSPLTWALSLRFVFFYHGLMSPLCLKEKNATKKCDQKTQPINTTKVRSFWLLLYPSPPLPPSPQAYSIQFNSSPSTWAWGLFFLFFFIMGSVPLCSKENTTKNCDQKMQPKNASQKCYLKMWPKNVTKFRSFWLLLLLLYPFCFVLFCFTMNQCCLSFGMIFGLIFDLVFNL